MLWPKNTHISKPFLACQKAVKPTYSNLEFQNFPGEHPRTPRFMGEGKGGEERGGAHPPSENPGYAPGITRTSWKYNTVQSLFRDVKFWLVGFDMDM